MAYGIQNLKQSVNRPARQDVTRLARMGRGGDDSIVHMTSGEMVLPKSMQSPGIMSLIAGKMRQGGVNPSQYIVGTPHAQANANPYTGAQQFPEPGGVGEGPGDAGFDHDSPGNDDGIDWSDYDPMDDTSSKQYNDAYDKQQEKEALYSKYGKVAGGILGFLGAGPMGLAAGAKGGAMVGGKMAGNFVDAVADTYGNTPSSAYSDPGMAGGQPGSVGISDLGSRNYDGGGNLGRDRLTDLMQGSISDPTLTNPSEGMTPVMPDSGPGSAQQYPTSAPQNIDYEHYGELGPNEGGGEKLMYPWQLPGGGMSYGQYPMFGGIEGWGPAPRPDGGEDPRGRWRNWRDRIGSAYNF